MFKLHDKIMLTEPSIELVEARTNTLIKLKKNMIFSVIKPYNEYSKKDCILRSVDNNNKMLVLPLDKQSSFIKLYEKKYTRNDIIVNPCDNRLELAMLEGKRVFIGNGFWDLTRELNGSSDGYLLTILRTGEEEDFPFENSNGYIAPMAIVEDVSLIDPNKKGCYSLACERHITGRVDIMADSLDKAIDIAKRKLEDDADDTDFDWDLDEEEWRVEDYESE